MTDYEAETRSTKRVPRDEFEAELFKQTIKAEIHGWGKRNDESAKLGGWLVGMDLSESEAERANRLFEASIGPEMDEDGSWELYVVKDEEYDYMSFVDRPSVRGRIWLEERPYSEGSRRVAVAWSLGSQTNSDSQPIVRWDLPNPAGPWTKVR
jgi:hypothetical protein